jgi:hypothetical protein
MYNATGIEHQLAIFLEKEIGARGGAHDADIFRSGNPKDLAKVVELIGKKLKERAARIEVSDEDKENGGNAPRLTMTGDSLLRIADQIKERSDREREDYHWLIVGDLCEALAVALDHIEQIQSPK